MFSCTPKETISAYIRTGLGNTQRELTSPIFDLAEPSGSSFNRVNEAPPCIDITKTFSPRPYHATISIKLFMNAWVIAIMWVSIDSYSYPSFWLAYLTNWGWVFSVAYFVLSLGLAVLLMLTKWRDGRVVAWLVKITWVIFAISLPAEVVITCLYWSLIFSGNVQYLNVMFHGIGALLLIVDGFVMNRIPLRMKHFILFEVFSLTYLLWTLIFAYSELTNPYQEDGYQDDDAIYATLRWKTSTPECVALSAIILLVVNPTVFMLCRWMSRILPKRLVDINSEDKHEDVELVANGA